MPFEASSYRGKWALWVEGPLPNEHGITFDRTPSGVISASPGKVRVCGWHLDFDERPSCWLDVTSHEEAEFVCRNLLAACDRNVDFATAHDERGTTVVKAPY